MVTHNFERESCWIGKVSITFDTQTTLVIGLTQLMNRINGASKQYGLTMNASKAKFMIIVSRTSQLSNVYQRESSRNSPNSLIWERWLISNGTWEKIRQTFIKMSKLFNFVNRIHRCYVSSTLFYWVKSWAFTDLKKRLEAFQMRVYRRILRSSWVARVTNGSVLERMNKGRKVINTMKRRKVEHLDHIMQNENKYQLDKEVLRQERTRKATRLHHLSFTHDILIIGKKLGFPKQPLNYSEALEEE